MKGMGQDNHPVMQRLVAEMEQNWYGMVWNAANFTDPTQDEGVCSELEPSTQSPAIIIGSTPSDHTTTASSTAATTESIRCQSTYSALQA